MIIEFLGRRERDDIAIDLLAIVLGKTLLEELVCHHGCDDDTVLSWSTLLCYPSHEGLGIKLHRLVHDAICHRIRFEIIIRFVEIGENIIARADVFEMIVASIE